MKYRMKRFLLALLLILSVAGVDLVCQSFKQSNMETAYAAQKKFDLADIPEYSDQPFVEVNENKPFFTKSNITTKAFEKYAKLDSKKRCGVTYANICIDIMPTEKRGKIGSVKPTGWHSVKYDFVDGKYLYNRCHLIGYQLSAENANKRNLITGTRYMNTEGMLPFENMVADYVKETENHVLYRVTPIFEGDNLVASGVLMEAYSVEDKGEGISFCVYCYNVQPGVTIDYSNGDNELSTESAQNDSKKENQEDKNNTKETQTECKYIVNTNTKKFHKLDCSSVPTISKKNYMEYTGTAQELIDQGYSPCKKCKPDKSN